MYLNLEVIKKLINCVMCTYYVLNVDKAVSLVIVANPESSKTQLIKQVKLYPFAYFTTDISYKLFISKFLDEVDRGEKYYLLIPDFINVISHRRSFDSFLPSLNSFLEEGIPEITYYGSEKKFSHSVKGGLITAVTKPIFEKRINTFKDIGFISRILPVSYSYSDSTVQAVHSSIEKGEFMENFIGDIELNFKKAKKFNVEIPNEFSRELRLMSVRISRKISEYEIKGFDKQTKKTYSYKKNLADYGFRMHKQLRTLCKGICIFNGQFKRKEVNASDIDDLKKFELFINFDFNEV